MANENGFTMLAVVLCMTAAMGLALAGWAAAGGDIHLGERNTDAKRAYSAAEAGLADYLDKLSQDNEYWLKCTNVPKLPNGSAPPVNQAWSGTGTTDPRVWRKMPTDPSASYTIELLPAPGYTSCQENVDKSMQAVDGTIKIRVTGRAGVRNPGTNSLQGSKEVYRSIVTTLRRAGFLDYLYFTDFETSDPTQLILSTGGLPVKRCLPTQTCPNESIASWAAQTDACQKYVRDGRDSVNYPGSIYVSGAWRDANIPCSKIVFASNDAIKGPFHTNDTMRICGTPDFGRNRASAPTTPIDRVEYYDWVGGCGSGDSPDFGNNTKIYGSSLPILQMPQSNSTLEADADPAYVFSGKTTIVLNGTTMTVNGSSMSLPPNGLIYVKNSSSACPEFNPLTPYAAAAGCGDVYLSGNYSKSLTIAAERDIVISDDVLGVANSGALMGLIANNFVRIEHHIAGEVSPCDSGDANAAGTETNRRVDAAILSLGHVFTVDNYHCGSTALGNLTVFGAIAQKYRGPVGTTGGTGYIKDYQYDDRLRFRSPPFFLAPIQSAWRAVRSTEQVPAT